MKKIVFFLLSLFSFCSGISAQAGSIEFVSELQNFLNSGDIEGAVRHFDSLPASLKDDEDLQILKASLLLSAGRLDEAQSVADSLLAKKDGNVEVLELKAQIAVAKQDKATLKATSEKLLSINPYNPTANIITANQYALRKNYKQANNYYTKALIGDSKNTEALFGSGQMNYYLGRIKESKTMFEKLLSIDPENADSYLYLGKLAAESENFLSATKNVEKAIKIDPSNYDYWIDLGQYLRSQGKFADAEKAWTKAIELDPDYFLAYTYRAGLYDEQNKIKEALSDYRNIVRTNPQYYFAYEEMGILEFHLKEWENARNDFIKANSYRSDWSYQLMIIATYIAQKNLIEAKKAAQQYMKLMPDKKSNECMMMRLFHDQGTVNAENMLSRNIEKEDNKNKKGKLWYYLGLYNELRGSAQVSQAYYDKVTAMQTPMFFEYRLAEWGIQ